MAKRYGEAALMAARMDTYGKALTAQERWVEAVKKLYPTSPAAQEKSGPRHAFVGLCEAGLVRGIEATEGKSNRSKEFAVEAVALLSAGSHTTITQLWTAVTRGQALAHTQQMDVVLALWKNGLIVSR